MRKLGGQCGGGALSGAQPALWYNSAHISMWRRALSGVQGESVNSMYDETVDETLSAIRQRRMVLPAILFLVGHRPLAFAFGQMLLILQPLAGLLGADGIGAWGKLLSQPGGPSALTERLEDLLQEDSHATHEQETEL